jgi:ParB family chromosome partitioning protein
LHRSTRETHGKNCPIIMTKTKKSAPRNTSLAVPETPSAAPAAPLSEQSSTTSAAASEAVASASEGTPAATPIVLLELNRIVCSTYNPRRNLNESSLDELALSMQQTGQLQPICVRGSGEHYEIVYGERRYRAAQRAGFTHIKALVYEHLTDEDAEDMAITENLQREDVAPLEEAAAFLRALKTGRHTVSTLVDKFGKSERYIRSHLKLNDLIEPLANLLEREEIIESMAIELAKYPSEVQQCVFEEHFANDGHNSWKNTSPRQVGQYLHDRYMTKLNTYKFDKTECSTCAENTANNILFSDLAEGCAGCENRACMIRKNDEFLVEKAIRMQRNDPRTLLAVEVGHYSDAVLERLTSQGYTVEVIDTYSMWEPDVPVLPDVEVPQESDYEDRDEYLEALAEYESEVSEYRENMKKLDAEIDAGRVRKYALIGMLDVDLFYEEVPEQIEETSDDEGVTVYTSIAPRPIVEELESRIVMAHRSCYTQMTTDLKRVLRETEISSSALAASESRLYGYSLLRLLPSRYAEKLGLEREALQDVQQIGDFLDHLDGDRMNMLMRSVIFDCMDHIEEFRQTDETFELQLLRQFALQQDKETSERVIAEHLDRLEKTQSRLEEQLHALEQRKAQELAAEVEAFDPVVPEDPAVPDAVPAEDVPEPEGEPLDPDLWPEASASLAA